MSQSSVSSQRCLNLKAIIIFLALLSEAVFSGFTYPDPVGNKKDLSFYISSPDSSLFTQCERTPIRGVIVCIGDGMGQNEVALARQKAVGLSGRLWLERLPVAGSARTSSADNAVTDSAAAATSLACGIKTRNGTIGIDTDGWKYYSILELLEQKGWRTGLVATSTISHATPASFASHVASRGNEADIVGQMLSAGVDVMFGGGCKFWLPRGFNCGVRADRKDMVLAAEQAGYTVIHTRQEMLEFDGGPIVGLFADSAMTTQKPEPLLFEMADKAISLLNKKNPDWFAPMSRFFLMIEGSQIDWAGHANDTDNSIRQTLLFDMAVKTAIEFVQKNPDVLLIVTADHETGGLALTAGSKDSKRVHADWTTKDHTAADVPVYAMGPGATEFAGVQNNSDIPVKIASLLGLETFPCMMKPENQVQKEETVVVDGVDE